MKKRILHIFLLLSIMLLCAASALAADTATVKKKTNLYKEASTSAGVYTVLQPGANLSVLESTKSFFKVTSGNKQGYVLKSKVWLDGDDANVDAPPAEDEYGFYTHGSFIGIELGMTQSHVRSVMLEFTPTKAVDNPDMLVYEEPLATNPSRKMQYFFWFTDKKLVALEMSTDGLISGEDVYGNFLYFYDCVIQIEGNEHSYNTNLDYNLDSDYAYNKFYKQIENNQLNYVSKWSFKDFNVTTSIVQGFNSKVELHAEEERLAYPRATFAIFRN